MSHQIMMRPFCVSSARGTVNYLTIPDFEGSIVGEPPADAKQAILDRVNKMRKAKGLQPVRRDPRLDKAAQKHADDLAAGRVHAHDQLEWRIHSFAGFPDEPCHITRKDMDANYTEGIVDQPDDVGDISLEALTHFGPGEGHYDDFYDPKINCIGIGIGLDGIGYMKNHLVLDYGVLCKLPEPEPLKREDFDLW